MTPLSRRRWLQAGPLIRAEADAHVLEARLHALDGTLIGKYVVPRRRV